ncbi:MAG: UDP-3-O-[3-hydroxymyristoyl] N-acetylglucosamine deacetylase, partial [candidate division WOR-3 bacterium]
MDIEKIKEILPHRYPFLFLDKILNLGENKIVALKQVTYNEWFFIGHFPNFPIMPGVLMVEAMAQASGV